MPLVIDCWLWLWIIYWFHGWSILLNFRCSILIALELAIALEQLTMTMQSQIQLRSTGLPGMSRYLLRKDIVLSRTKLTNSWFLSGAVHFTASNNDSGIRDFDMERFQLTKYFFFPWPVNVSGLPSLYSFVNLRYTYIVDYKYFLWLWSGNIRSN